MRAYIPETIEQNNYLSELLRIGSPKVRTREMACPAEGDTEIE